MSIAKVELTIGNFKFAGEGEQDWLSAELEKALDRGIEAATLPANKSSSLSPASSAESPSVTGLAINSIAAKVGVKSGSDLALAAVYSLTRSGKEQVSRAELLTEMRNATSYYKNTYRNNLSAYITTLIKDGKLLEQAAETYALSASARSEIEAKLA